ncbi:MAG TPA: hypothetical protein VFB28_02000 [Terriglobales bacterium]|jgi:hypothetical protein|nr:hypothetical protein [Terriglobales bacterium]
MWLQRLCWGVLRVLTPIGPRYVKPSFRQRVYLLWIFRNFHTLPVKVLSPKQQHWIDGLCAEKGFVPLSERDADFPVLGTLEQRPAMEPQRFSTRAKPASDSVAPFAADAQHRL